MLVLVNGNKFKLDRQQHNSTSNFVSANSLIAKFIRQDASFIASLCVKCQTRSGTFIYMPFKEMIEKNVSKKCFFLMFQLEQNTFDKT